MKYVAIEAWRTTFPVQRLCTVLGVSRSGYYAWRERKPSQHDQDDAVLTQQIKRIWQANRRCYGAPRIHAELKDQGIAISRKRVARLMQQAHLQVMPPKPSKPRTTIAHPAHPVFANRLNRQFTATAPNQKWIADITYVDTNEGYLYVAGIQDLYSRKIVGLAMADHMETDLVEAAWRMAWVERQPGRGLLHHSDRGSQYTSKRYQDLLAGLGATVSMSRTGECLDSAPIESFWGRLKAECATAPFATRAQARAEIFRYVMGWYNRTRRHSALGYMSPDQFERHYSRQLYCPN